jgi:uncharacterized protein
MNAELTGFATLEPHRMVRLEGDHIALICEESTGWCVLSAADYASLQAHLGKGRGLDYDSQDDAARAVLSELWNAGLLRVNLKRNPETIRQKSRTPSSILLKVTGACDFDCTYCYDYDERRYKTKLDAETAKQAIATLLSKRNDLSIVFHGGEPLLRPKFIRDIVDSVKIIARKKLANVKFGVQTNGSHLTSEIREFFKLNNFSVGISIDGISSSANIHRKTRTKLRAPDYIRKLFDDDPEFVRDHCGFLATISRESAPYLPDFALFLQSSGVAGLAFSFLDVVGRGADLSSSKLDPEETVRVYATFIEMIREGTIRDLAIRTILSRIDNLFTFQPGDFCSRGPCAASDDFLVLDSEGKFRSCDCVYHPYFELGDQNTSVDKALANPARAAIDERHNWLRREGATCGTCPLFGLCGGTCVAKAIALFGTERAVDPGECARVRYLYPLLLQEFAGSNARPVLEYYNRHKLKSPDIFGNLQ